MSKQDIEQEAGQQVEEATPGEEVVELKPNESDSGGITPAVAPAIGEIVYLPLNTLKPAPDNPRGEGDYGDLKELAATLRSQGVLQPLTVCTPGEDGLHMIVIGHRRFEAAKLAKLATVPVCIRSLTEPQRIEAMAVENGQRQDLTPLAEARTYRQLVNLGYSQRKLATRLGRSQAQISRRLALLELPEPAAQAVDAGAMRIEDAVELSKLAEAPSRMAEVLEQHSEQGGRIKVKHSVEEQLRQQRRQEAIEAAIRRVKESGVTYLDLGALSRKGRAWDASILKRRCRRADAQRDAEPSPPNSPQISHNCSSPASPSDTFKRREEFNVGGSH